MTALMKSWVTSANSSNTDFPLNNLPYGVFSLEDGEQRCGVAIGDMILDLSAAEEHGVLNASLEPVFDWGAWNEFMELGPETWSQFRNSLISALSENSTQQTALEPFLVAQNVVTMHMPFAVSEYTDFYAGRHHATNIGTMFRGAENALPPNWLHMPIGYNGRASSVVVSGTDIRRPWGQLKGPNDEMPRFAPSERFDIELEMGAIVGQPSNAPLSVSDADEMIFGYVLLNDWSARDIQAWEYQPLGPFQAKATATTISPWIVTREALAPFRCDPPKREKPLLAHLQDQDAKLYDVALSVTLMPEDGDAFEIASTNFNQLYYTSAQQLAHHSTSGCPMNVGDLLGSGTISGPQKTERGSMVELSWGGKEPITLPDGTSRSFIHDGDTLTLRGAAAGDGYKIGFGDCSGKVIPALKTPYK